ncbi:putative polyketide synthase [Xylariales sp. PMI_506]|nr:putative polyketide synthase [Xylariales sp. PMI_506]
MPSKRQPVEPIAIIGMGLRLPGGVSTPDQFWDQLVNKKDGRCRVPADRYNVDAFYGNNTQRQTVASEYGYFLEDVDLKSFDTSFFASSQMANADLIDPQQRLLLEVVWECIESAGQTKSAGSNTGVYVGNFGEDWHNILHADKGISNSYRVIAGGDYALSNLLSFYFDLRACQALRNGECDTAIVAGVSIITEPSMTLDMSEQGVLSPTGSCKTFDASADGFARGEAVNAIMIKPLDDALRDGDPIRAIIRSSALNSDGRMSSIGSPSSEAQETLIRRAYAMAGIDDFSQTPFIECHGTGTPVGDPLEVAAVANVFGEHGAYIGSVKPNVGHGEGASGLTSIIKAVLSLENATIPPNIMFSEPNPKIPFKKNGLAVPLDPIPWPKDRHPRISINSFGIGGANAHVILDSTTSWSMQHVARRQPVEKATDVTENAESGVTSGEAVPRQENANAPRVIVNRHPQCPLDRVIPGESSPTIPASSATDVHERSSPWPRLLPVSANTEKSLQRRIADLQQYIVAEPGCINDVAHTLDRHRIHFPYRSYCIVQDGVSTPLEFSPVQKVRATTANDSAIVYAFTGQGAQWAGMGKSLINTVPSFREDIRQMDLALQQLPNAPDWSIEAALCRNDEAAQDDLKAAKFSQPLCTAVQLAIVNFLAECGILPFAVVGHSSGEIAAAYAAGAINMSEAIVCAYIRGQASQRHVRNGGMAAIGLGKKAILPYLKEGVQIACFNSPKSVTISGDLDAVEEVLEAIRVAEPDTFVRRLKVNIAYHSYHMLDVGDSYWEMLTPHLRREHKPRIPFYSTVSGQLATTGTHLDAAYWRSNLESPVLFDGAVQKLMSELPGITSIVEIGPHSALQAPLRQILQAHGQKKAPTYIPTLVRDNDPVFSLITTLGRLYVNGSAVDLSLVNPQAALLTDLPNYPWHHEAELWRESRISKAWRFREHAHHELLGSRCLESADTTPMWRNVMQQFEVPWLRDHQIGSNTIFPCAGFIAMMGEAIRQTMGSESYILRDLMVKAALLVPDTGSIELMTVMRPSRLTQMTNSGWYDISISSFDGSVWEEHCIAQGRGGQDTGDGINSRQRLERMIRPCPRKVPKSFFYERMNHMGIKYGSHFRGLEDLSAHPEEQVAVASFRNYQGESETRYTIHPVTIDLCMQLIAVAGSRGICRNIDGALLPVEVRSIIINPGGPNLTGEATIDPTTDSQYVMAVTDNGDDVAIEIENGRAIEFDGGDHNNTKNEKHAARVHWRPDIDYLDAKGLLSRGNTKRDLTIALEKIARLSLLLVHDTSSRLITTPTGHLSKYLSWLKETRLRMTDDVDILATSEANEWIAADWDSRCKTMDFLLEDIDGFGDPDASSVARLMRDTVQSGNIEAIFAGDKDPLESLMADTRLNKLYSLNRNCVDVDELLQLCSHAQPTMNLLEVGVGSGDTAEAVFSSLVSDTGARMYSRYVFTDISAHALGDAEARFQGREAVEYKVFDVEKSPAEQGFEVGSFDLVIVSNGLLPSWWVGENDDRIKDPCVSVERWDQELRDAGFTGCDAAILDDEPPYSFCAHMISTAKIPQPETSGIILLYNSERPEFGVMLAELLGKEGIHVSWSTIAEAKNSKFEGQDIISLLDLEAPYLDNIPENNYTELQSLLNDLQTGILWITHSVQLSCNDPRYGLILGFARTIRKELGIDIWTVELQTLDETEITLTSAIIRSFRSRAQTTRKLDCEYIIRDGVVHVGRYHWISVPRELEAPLQDSDPKRLRIGQFGLIDSLHWTQEQSLTTLEADQIEIQVRCVGLNFRDIMTAIGLVKGSKDCLGNEATGVVLRVGSGVDHVKVGDRVAAVSNGLFSTRKVLPARDVIPIPEHFSFEEAATLPIVYLTVVYALMFLGQLTKGMSVLVHSATGGVGQAAIQICQMFGAEIYATVGNEEKVKYLVEKHNIPRHRIFNSRNTSFLQDVMRATSGRGVDIVLNSLSGDLLHASWNCVAKCGKMMEIGKRDILERGSVGLDMFQNNRTFYGIDLSSLHEEKKDVIPSTLSRLFKTLSQLVSGSHVKAIQPIHTFPAINLLDAFRFMKKGQHIGKIVITMPEDTNEILATKAPSAVSFSEAATYLLVGGLGGLGKALTRWMVERGARHFCFMSRSAGKSDDDQAFLRELDFLGCKAVAVSGSVAEMDHVQRAIAEAPSRIAGVFHMCMVLKDLSFLDTGYAEWKAVQDPKVKGAWNLHRALEGVNLDFFVLISSIAGALGHRGQANYASANTFLDCFSQYRHGLGLSCSVIQLGCMEGIGYLSDKPWLVHQIRCGGVFLLQEQHLMDAIQISIDRSAPTEDVLHTNAAPRGGSLAIMSQLITGVGTTIPLSHPHNLVPFRDDLRLSLYYNIDSAQSTAGSGTEVDDDRVQQLLAEAEADPEMLDRPCTLEEVSIEIGRTLFRFLLLPEEDMDIGMNLESIGVDSLLCIEIRNWWRRTLGCNITVLEIKNAATIEGLGRLAIASLQKKYGIQETGGGEKTG